EIDECNPPLMRENHAGLTGRGEYPIIHPVSSMPAGRTDDDRASDRRRRGALNQTPVTKLEYMQSFAGIKRRAGDPAEALVDGHVSAVKKERTSD
ncbi:hypothetical protein FRC07_007732, partial [Ceratobasidium sp. 392]